MAKKQLTIEEKLQAALVPVEEQPYKVPENWCWVKFSVTYDNVSSSRNKIKQKDYQNEGEFAIVDQGENLIGGYSNDEDMVYDGGLPVIIFGDHTRRIKYVNFPFIQGADGVKVLQPKDYIVPRYYYFCLQSMEIPHMGYRRHFPILNKMGFPVAPIAEQSRIVARIESLFAKLDEAKEKIQEVLDGADLRRAAILHQAFTGKLTEKWRRENSVSDDWDYKLLYQTDIQIIDGDRGKNYPKKDEFTSSGYCVFLNAKNVTKNGFLFDEIQYISKEKDESLRKGKLERGDIVLTTRGTVGNIAYYDEKIPFDNMRINSGMVIYRGGMDFYKPFLIWLYKSSYIINQIKKLKTGSAQPQLPIKVMNNLNICIPSIPEQQEIVRLLDDLLSREQATVNACEKALNTIDTLKKSILARAFRGELGTNDPSEAGAQELLQEILAS